MTADPIQEQHLMEPATPILLPGKLRDLTRYGDIARIAFPSLLLCFALLNWVPWQPAVIPNELDGSWGLALHWAFLHHLDFGHQFVFTFGPWGFIWQGALAGTLNTVVIAWIGLASVFTAALVSVGNAFIPRFWPRALCMAVVVILSSLPVELIQDVRLLAIVWLFLFVQIDVDGETDRRPRTALKAMLAIAVALASLVKFSITTLVVPIVFIGCLNDVLRRRFPLASITYAGSVLAFWHFAHQNLSSLGPYLRHSLIIASGYAQGEGISTPDEPLSVFQFLVLGFCFFAIVSQRKSAACEDASRSVDSNWKATIDHYLAIAALSFSLLVTFKIGYVRHDQHELSANIALVVLILLYFPFLAGRLRAIKMRRFLPALLLVTPVLMLNESSFFWEGQTLPLEIAHLIYLQPSRLRSAEGWFAGDSSVQPEFRALRSLSSAPDVPIASLAGGVDEFGFKQWRLIADAADYRPRPVMQLYLCYTPQISRLNADFLAGANAPANLLFDISPSDEHYPAIEDSLSWPQVIRSYAVAGHFPGFLLLHRRPQRASLTLTPLQEAEGCLGRLVTVPNSSGCIWSTFRIELTPLGRVLRAIYKNPALQMEVQTADGFSRYFRLIPDMARAGFILSPELISRSSLASVCASPNSPPANVERVVAIKIDDDGGAIASYYSKFRISFFRMDYAMR